MKCMTSVTSKGVLMLGKFKFWGSATVGTKGQLVIPAEAREALGIKEGDKLLIVSPPQSESIMVVKPDVLEEHMQRVQTTIKDVLDASTSGTPQKDEKQGK